MFKLSTWTCYFKGVENLTLCVSVSVCVCVCGGGGGGKWQNCVGVGGVRPEWATGEYGRGNLPFFLIIQFQVLYSEPIDSPLSFWLGQSWIPMDTIRDYIYQFS